MSVAASHSPVPSLGGHRLTVAGLPGSSVPGLAGGIDWVQQCPRRLQRGFLSSAESPVEKACWDSRDHL